MLETGVTCHRGAQEGGDSWSDWTPGDQIQDTQMLHRRWDEWSEGRVIAPELFSGGETLPGAHLPIVPLHT